MIKQDYNICGVPKHPMTYQDTLKLNLDSV